MIKHYFYYYFEQFIVLLLIVCHIQISFLHWCILRTSLLLNTKHKTVYKTSYDSFEMRFTATFVPSAMPLNLCFKLRSLRPKVSPPAPPVESKTSQNVSDAGVIFTNERSELISNVENDLSRVNSKPKNSIDGGISKGELLNEIREGVELKSLVGNGVKGTGPILSATDKFREELLGKIREGVKLKPVEQQSVKSKRPLLDGIAGALERVLEERSKAIYGDESSASESSDDYDEEWYL